MRPVEQHDDPEQACLLQLPLLTCGRRGPSSRDTRAAAPAIAREQVRCYVHTPGAMVPRPPIMMPRLAKLAKPHIA